ncbi:MAG TPA: rhodanese-like domain-containing protein [Gaiellaceae bacterium]|nr:rhodanese-like domain-containing protein [Gaiellaceae bacterium]
MDDGQLRDLYFRAKLAAEAQFVETARQIREGTLEQVLLDTRPRAAYLEGHIPGALCFPLAHLDALARRLPRELAYITYCWRAACHLAAHAALRLNERGFEVRELNAGWREWQEAGDPIETEEREFPSRSC